MSMEKRRGHMCVLVNTTCNVNKLSCHIMQRWYCYAVQLLSRIQRLLASLGARYCVNSRHQAVKSKMTAANTTHGCMLPRVYV
jgi:hypothetical protein